MAPRGRRASTTAMDAALCAMCGGLGFEEKLVRETVKELLKVYGGTQGWPFLEEDSYRLLIETILGKQEEKKKKDSLQDNARKDGVTETSLVANGIPEVGSSSLVAQGSLLQMNGIPEVGSSSLVAQGSLLQMNGIPEVGSSSLVAQGSPLQMNGIPEVGSSSLVAQGSLSPGVTDLTELKPVRKPCYGWISNDSDDDELVQPYLIERLVRQSEAPQKRMRNRWDQRPDDE